MDLETLQKVARLLRDGGLSSQDSHTIVVAIHIGAEHSFDAKHIKSYGTVACEQLQALHREMEES